MDSTDHSHSSWTQDPGKTVSQTAPLLRFYKIQDFAEDKDSPLRKKTSQGTTVILCFAQKDSCSVVFLGTQTIRI